MSRPRPANYSLPVLLRERFRDEGLSLVGVATTMDAFYIEFSQRLSARGKSLVTVEDTIVALKETADRMYAAWFAAPEARVFAAITRDRTRVDDKGRRVSLKVLAEEAGTSIARLRAWHDEKVISLDYRGGPWPRKPATPRDSFDDNGGEAFVDTPARRSR